MGFITGETYVIDRFEVGQAILIDNGAQAHNVSRALMPENAREGDILLYENGSFTVDFALTASKRKSVAERFERLKKKK